MKANMKNSVFLLCVVAGWFLLQMIYSFVASGVPDSGPVSNGSIPMLFIGDLIYNLSNFDLAAIESITVLSAAAFYYSYPMYLLFRNKIFSANSAVKWLVALGVIAVSLIGIWNERMRDFAEESYSASKAVMHAGLRASVLIALMALGAFVGAKKRQK